MEETHRYLVIVFIALICYFNTLFGSFVFDDSEAIVKNKDVMPNTPISQVFGNDFWGTDIKLNMSHKSYRPLTILSYRLNVILSGGNINSFHFHLTNVLLYIVLCILAMAIYKLFIRRSKRVKDNSETPFMATLLFTVHPVHTEVVAGLVGRADILSSILFLASVLTYSRAIRKKSIVLFITAVTLVSAAVLCKETAITALGLCSVYDIFYTKLLQHRSMKQFFLYNKPFLYRNFGLILTGVVVIYLRLLVMDFQGPIFTKIDNPAAYSDSLYSKVLTYNYVYLLNILLLLWPQWLCFDWSMGCIPLIENFCDIRVIAVLIFWSIAFSGGKIILKTFLQGNISVPTILGISLMVLPFIPASNLFVKVGFVIAERTLLLPSMGFCLLIVLGVNKLISSIKNKRKARKAVNFIFYLLCTLFTIRTIIRNFQWLNEEELFVSALEVCPLNAKVHYNVAKVAADKHERQLAMREYNKAIELNPDYEQAMNNLANLFREDKRFVEAEILLRQAVEVRPNFAAAWMNLGIVLTNLNQTREAEECYLKAITYRPKYPDCYYNLGNLYLDMRRNVEALKAWEQSVHYRPTHTAAWSNTLVLLDSLNRYEEVLNLGRTALMHNPKSPALHFSIANTLGKIQEFEKAEKHFLEAVNLNPHNALYYSNLGVLYHRWGKTERAREMYRKALQIDPRMKTTENNLRKLLNAQSTS